MNYNQFSNLSCYEEFEIQCALAGISKIDVLKEFGHKIGDYYSFVSEDGIFNWFDLEGNHVENPGVLKEIKQKQIPLSISKCIIPDSVTHIGIDAFRYCYSLTSITISDSVISISDRAFAVCKSLPSITIPNSVTSIGEYVFADCRSLTSISIPDSVTSIGGWAFYSCNSLKEVIFKGKTLEEVKQMKNYPFGIRDKSIIKCEM
jgi:hypothetical protein